MYLILLIRLEHVSVLLSSAGHCFNQQNFREMIPVLGVFRILAIVIFGMFALVLTAHFIVFLTASAYFENVKFNIFSVFSWNRFWICLLQKIYQ